MHCAYNLKQLLMVRDYLGDILVKLISKDSCFGLLIGDFPHGKHCIFLIIININIFVG